MKTIEVLAFKGCPNVAAALEQARLAVDATGIAADVRVVLVEDEETANRLRFLGSPTVRVDAVDVDRSRNDEVYGLRCRLYVVDGRHTGAPPAAWIAAALRGLEEPHEP